MVVFVHQVIREKRSEWRDKPKLDMEAEEPFLGLGKKRLAFLDLLINVSDDGKYLTDEDIREEVDTFLFEGHDTTAAGIAFALLAVGYQPDVEEKIQKELDDIFGTSNRPATIEDLKRMTYLECVLKEALRFVPSVPLVGRYLKEDIVLGGNVIPAGVTLAVLIIRLHRDPVQFPHPEKFVPERFLPGNCQDRSPFAYIPFSCGPRNCIGQRFALMEEKVVLSRIFRSYSVKSVVPIEDMRIVAELITRSLNGVRIQITPRKRQ